MSEDTHEPLDWREEDDCREAGHWEDEPDWGKGWHEAY